MKNIKLIIEYDGTEYAGWQRQTNALSVQQVIEDALNTLTGSNIELTGSGRTDSGVHARGQVANFHTDSTIPPERFSFALNTLLPKDIRIVHSMEVPDCFHARYSAIGKRYRYSMITNPHGTAIGSRYYCHVPYPLDVEAMKRACSYIIGTHDFAAFQAAGSAARTTVRTIGMARIVSRPPFLYFDIEGSGFLYNMVRILAGTLLEIGKGKLAPDNMPEIIKSRDRRRAGPTAPAQGLSLEEVYYEGSLGSLESGELK